VNYAFFEKLTPVEAQDLLAQYLETESAAWADLHVAADGVPADFSVDSVPSVLRWAVARVATVAVEPDPAEPEWIRTSAPYLESLFEFDQPSTSVVLAASYYLGESFVRTYPALRWATGDVNFALQNQPVVAGFHHDLELSPVLVTENLFLGIRQDPTKIEKLDRVVATWRRSAEAG
jgi:hypothetical protein